MIGSPVTEELAVTRADSNATSAWDRETNPNPLITAIRIILSRPYLVVVLFTLTYLVPTLKLAESKAIWDDEFFTLSISRNTPSEILKASATGADQTPPVFFFVTHTVMQLLGSSHLALRLPAILGYWLACVCLFLFVSRRTSNSWGVIAMLCPMATWGYFYAYEARGYGMLLGFSALALLAWQRATDKRWRPAWMAVLIISLAMTVWSHYYAVFVLAALCVGEITRTCFRKQLDVPVLLSLLVSFAAILPLLPAIRKAHGYSHLFWADVSWGKLIPTYATLVYPLSSIIVLLLFLAVARIIYGKRDFELDFPSAFLPWELTTAAALMAIPVFAMTASKLVTHGFATRYSLPALLGIVIVSIEVGFRFSRTSRRIPLIIGAFVFLFVGLNVLRSTHYRADVARLSPVYLELKKYADMPIVCGEAYWIYKLSFYAPQSFARNLVYLPDPQLSVRYLGYDTADREVLALRPWFPVNVADYRAFLQSHSSFLVLDGMDKWSWISSDLLSRKGFQMQMLHRFGPVLLFMVTRTDSATLPRTPVEDKAQLVAAHSHGRDDLFSTIHGRASLCSQWMPGDPNCAVLH